MTKKSDTIRKSVNTLNDLLEAVKFSIEAVDRGDELNAEHKRLEKAVNAARGEKDSVNKDLADLKVELKKVRAKAKSVISDAEAKANELLARASKSADEIVASALSEADTINSQIFELGKSKAAADEKLAEVNKQIAASNKKLAEIQKKLRSFIEA